MISPATELALQAIARDAGRDPERFCECLYRLAELLAEQSTRLVKHSNAAGIAGHAMRSTAVGYAAWSDRLGPELWGEEVA
jgi:hypothetical protein